MFDVLIVEDDPMVAEINRGYLERAGGFRLVGIAANSADALVLLSAATVALVLLDISMPGMDGLTLLREIRERHSNVDVIMVTASAGSRDVQTALRLGVADYVVKPFTFERFQAALVSYKERTQVLRAGEPLSQKVLDECILLKSGHSRQLPKGVDPKTLKLVQDTIAGSEKEYKTGDLVLLTGLSRVSIKKYLDYLESISCISSSLIYPPMGRPVTVFRWIGGGEENKR